MNKKNHRANNSCARLNFWNSIKRQLDGFYNMIQPIDALTTQDRKILHEIHYMLYTCKTTAQGQEDLSERSVSLRFRQKIQEMLRTQLTTYKLIN